MRGVGKQKSPMALGIPLGGQWYPWRHTSESKRLLVEKKRRLSMGRPVVHRYIRNNRTES